MFINYFSHTERESAFNLKAARFIISGYAIWKLVSFEWVELVSSPLQPYGFYSFFYPPHILEPLIIVEVAAAIFCLSVFPISRKLKLSGVISAALIAHLSGLLQPLTVSSGSFMFLPIVFSLIFLGMYDIEELKVNQGNYQLKPLKWLILFLGVYYFSAGFGKIFSGDIVQWITPQNFERLIHFTEYITRGESQIAGTLASYDLVLYAGQLMTVLLEMGFLLAILAGISVVPFFTSLALMHVMIFLVFGINFLENLIIFSVFLPWDQFKRRIEVLYDNGRAGI